MGNSISQFAFYPPQSSYNLASLPANGIIKTFDGDIAFSITFVNSAPKDRIIVFSHGNAEDLGSVVLMVSKLANKIKCDILCYDYRGYGQSSPITTTAYTATEDLRNVILFVKRNMPNREIILMGRSIGSGPTSEVAKEFSIKTVILQSAFTSILDVGMPSLSSIAPINSFENLENVRGFNADTDLLVIHGTADQVIPFSHGKTLVKEAQCNVSYCWLKDSGHNDINYSSKQIISSITSLLKDTSNEK